MTDKPTDAAVLTPETLRALGRGYSAGHAAQLDAQADAWEARERRLEALEQAVRAQQRAIFRLRVCVARAHLA